MTPSEVLGAIVADRRMLEVAATGPRAPRRVAPAAVRRRPGPRLVGGVARRAARLPRLGGAPGPGGHPGRRGGAARDRRRRGAGHDDPRGQGTGVPDRHPVRHDRRRPQPRSGVAILWPPEGGYAVRITQERADRRLRGCSARRRADGRVREAPAAVRRCDPGPRPPRRLAAPRTSRTPAPPRNDRRRRWRRRRGSNDVQLAQLALPTRRFAAADRAAAAVRGLARRHRSGPGSRAGQSRRSPRPGWKAPNPRSFSLPS